MREHQIVITLKPEQFLQVQKLAKNAGAKSMGMFVRQKLLMALGIEAAAAQQVSNAADIEPLVGELKRLHTELREFVNESLAMYSEGLINGSLGTPVTDQESVLVADPSPQIKDSQQASSVGGGGAESPAYQASLQAQQAPLSQLQQADAASQTPQGAARQILPPQNPNASLPSQKSFPQAFIDAKPAPPVMPIADPEDNYYEPENTAIEETSFANTEEESVEQLYEDEPLTDDENGLEEQEEYQHEDQPPGNEILQSEGADMDSEEAYNDVSYAELAAEIAESGNMAMEEHYENEVPAPSAAAGTDPEPSMLNDDMESTANKTFAISPRLGPIDPGVPDSQTALPQTPSFRTVERKKPNLPISTPPAVPSDEIRNEDNDPAAIRSSLAPGAGPRPSSVPMRQQPKRDPLAELLSDEDFEKQQKPAPRVTPNNDPDQTEDESDETFDIPLSLMQRRRTLEEMNKDVPADNSTTGRNINEQQSTSGPTTNKQTNLNSNSANNDQSTSTAHPHHSRIHAAETNLSSPEEKPQNTGAQGSTPAPQSWSPLENPDEDTPLSGGPPPKKRQ